MKSMPVIFKAALFGLGRKKPPNYNPPYNRTQLIFGMDDNELPTHLKDYAPIEDLGDGHIYKVKSNINNKIYDVNNEEGSIREAQYPSFKEQFAAFDKEHGLESEGEDDYSIADNDILKSASKGVNMKSMPVIFKSAALFKEEDLKKSDFSSYRQMPAMKDISDQQIAARILSTEAKYPDMPDWKVQKYVINSFLEEQGSKLRIKGKQ